MRRRKAIFKSRIARDPPRPNKQTPRLDDILLARAHLPHDFLVIVLASAFHFLPFILYSEFLLLRCFGHIHELYSRGPG